MRGRKPLPTLIKKNKGTLQKCRTNKREPKPKTLLGEPPEQLSEGAKQAWRLAIACAPQGLLTGLDANILAAWAVAADLFLARAGGAGQDRAADQIAERLPLCSRPISRSSTSRRS